MVAKVGNVPLPLGFPFLTGCVQIRSHRGLMTIFWVFNGAFIKDKKMYVSS